jgi:hypothetical protein
VGAAGGLLGAGAYHVEVPFSDRTVYLHIGPPKTGTTYLQDVLWRNRELLARRGMTFPGDSPAAHFYAALDLREIRFGGHDNPEVPGSWPQLVERIHNAPTPSVVVSHEVLSGADGAEIARVGHDLAGAEIHIVCGVRDLARQLPAVWQESLKNRRTREFGPFVSAALQVRERRDLPRGFWRGQDTLTVLSRWSTIARPQHVHVVTVPPRGAAPDELWGRFAQALGMAPEGFDLDVTRSNTSLNAEDAELLRRLNAALPDDLPWPAYERLVKRRFRQLAQEHAGTGTPLRIQRRYAAQVAEYAATTQDALSASGYAIVGDLADLRSDESAFGPDEPQPPTDQPTPVEAGDIVSDADVDALAREIVRKAHRNPQTPLSQARTLMTQIRRRQRARRP